MTKYILYAYADICEVLFSLSDNANTCTGIQDGLNVGSIVEAIIPVRDLQGHAR